MSFSSYYSIEGVTSLASPDYDGIVLVTDSLDKLVGELVVLRPALEKQLSINQTLTKEVNVVYTDAIPSNRLVFSPTGPLNRDYDDVRNFADAAENGIKRCIKAGCKRPLLVRAPDTSFPDADLVSVLGALHGLYVTLENRDKNGNKFDKVEKLGIWGKNAANLEKLISASKAIETGRIVCRDIGGSDPERMAAPMVAVYVENIFKNSSVKVNVISDQSQIDHEYPLLGAVNRCAKGVPRHQARVIRLTYEGEGPINTTLLFVGKGVTYDTGGADVKAGGIMAGMHRDKCGAAAVAGFFQILNALKPKGIKVIGTMAMVRNSIGSDCYVSDEIITARSGVRVRVGNTDAEGRMAMADPLNQLKDQALNEINPHLFTIATLTGHCVLAVGEAYTIAIDNGPAKQDNSANTLQQAGESIADPFEISTLRREDYKFIEGKTESEDVLQCNNAPSSRTPRGHQFPAAFLVKVSGLDKHGVDSKQPLKYSHLDIAGSSGPYPGVPSGAPIVALAQKYVLNRL